MMGMDGNYPCDLHRVVLGDWRVPKVDGEVLV